MTGPRITWSKEYPVWSKSSGPSGFGPKNTLTRLKVGEKRVKNKLKASCQDLLPRVMQLTDCFLEHIKGWQAHHPLWESIPLDNCQGIKGILLVVCLGVDLVKSH